MQSAKACCVCKIILLLFRTTTTELIQVRMGRVYGFLSICQLGNGAHFLLYAKQGSSFPMQHSQGREFNVLQAIKENI